MATRWSLKRLQEEALKHDVTYDAHRWFSEGSRGNITNPLVLEAIRQGHESEVVRWLESMTPEGMKYGLATREVRLVEAKEHAKLAKKMLPAIAIEHGLLHVLNPNPAT